MASGWLLLMHIFLLPSTQGLPGYRGPPGEKGDLGDPGPEGRSVSTSLYVPLLHRHPSHSLPYTHSYPRVPHIPQDPHPTDVPFPPPLIPSIFPAGQPWSTREQG